MRAFLSFFTATSFALALFFYASFFANLASTLSVWTGWGFVWSEQVFYNFLHGRPFQSSYFANPLVGVTVGFVSNPYAYINTNVIHVNFTPYLFAYPWALNPTPAWLYGLIFLWSLAGGALFTWLILKRLSPQDFHTRAAVALAVLFGGGFLAVLDQMAQLLLFAGPFMMAAYYFFLARRKGWFALSIVALSLVSEDAAMVAATFAAHLFLFEEEGRPYAFIAAGIAVPYLLFALKVLQPAARAELTLSTGTTTVLVLKHMFRLSPRLLAGNLWSMAPVVTLLPAFLVAGALFGWPAPGRRLRLASLALLPALPHWGECAVVGAAHHLLPPFVFTFLALVRMLGDAPGRGEARRSAWVAAAVFFLVSLRVLAGNFPNAMRPRLYRLAGMTEKADTLERSLRGGEESNREVIRAARSLPPSAGLSFLTNKSAAGFLADRSDLWLFPDLFDRAEYLLIQKDASDPTFLFDPAAGADLRSALKKSGETERTGVPLSLAMVRAIKDALVAKERTHEVALDNEHVLLLKNIKPKRVQVSPATVGFGFIRYLSHKPGPIAPDVAW